MPAETGPVLPPSLRKQLSTSSSVQRNGNRSVRCVNATDSMRHELCIHPRWYLWLRDFHMRSQPRNHTVLRLVSQQDEDEDTFPMTYPKKVEHDIPCSNKSHG